MEAGVRPGLWRSLPVAVTLGLAGKLQEPFSFFLSLDHLCFVFQQPLPPFKDPDAFATSSGSGRALKYITQSDPRPGNATCRGEAKILKKIKNID